MPRIGERTLDVEDDEPWRLLEPGDAFTARSRSGNEYPATFLVNGPPCVGIYIRLDDGKLDDPARDQLEDAHGL